MEKKLQTEIKDFLRANGVYVITTRVLPGVPVGCPDIVGLYENKWLVIEVKKDANAPFRVGQKPTLERLKNWNSYVYIAYPENWSLIKDEIIAKFL